MYCSATILCVLYNNIITAINHSTINLLEFIVPQILQKYKNSAINRAVLKTSVGNTHR